MLLLTKDIQKWQNLLLTSKADVNAIDDDDCTPLHYAAQNGHREVEKLLIANKADVNARDGDGNTPLYMTAQKGQAKVVKLLLAKKAKLSLTAQNVHTKVMKLLLAKKAKLNAPGAAGGKLDDAARKNLYSDILKLSR